MLKFVIFSFEGLLLVLTAPLCGIYVGVICSCFVSICFLTVSTLYASFRYLLSVGSLNDSTELLLLSYMQSTNGLGLKATRGTDYCQTTIHFPSDTIPKWVNIPTSWGEITSSNSELCVVIQSHGLIEVKQLTNSLTSGVFCVNRKIQKLENLKLCLLILIYVKLWLHGNM